MPQIFIYHSQALTTIVKLLLAGKWFPPVFFCRDHLHRCIYLHVELHALIVQQRKIPL